MNHKHLRFTVVLLLAVLTAGLLCGCEKEGLFAFLKGNTEPSLQLQLNTEFVTILKDETYALSVTARRTDSLPTWNTVWTSDNPKIVIVDNGVIYGVSTGTTNIRARVTVEGNYDDVRELVCTVTVSQNEIPLKALRLDDSPLTLSVGDSAALQPTFDPGNSTQTSLIWESSDPEILTVDNDGVVVANKKGTVTVTATSMQVPELHASCSITVKEDSANSVKRISLDRTTLSLLSGSSKQLNATVLPQTYTGPLTWTSDNPAVARVSESGQVEAVSQGTAYITVSAGNASALCRVTVSEGSSIRLPAERIELDQTYLRVVSGPYTFRLTAVLFPILTTETGRWSSSDTSVATVSENGLVTVKALTSKKPSASVDIIYAVNSNVRGVCHIDVVSPNMVATGISFSAEKYDLFIGDSVPLLAFWIPDTATDPWVWTSSDPTVLSVSEDGLLTALSSGTAVITVSSRANPRVYASRTFSAVSKEVDVRLTTGSGEVTFPSLDPLDIGIVFDDPKRIPPSAVYTLTPDDPESATVLLSELRDPTAQFRIQPLRAGEIRLTLTITEEESEGIPVSQAIYRCEPLVLNVSEPPQLTLSLPQAEQTLPLGESFVLNPTLLPEGTTGYSLVAESDAPNIVSVSEPLTITALTSGTATIRIYLQEDPTVSTSLVVTVPDITASNGEAS